MSEKNEIFVPDFSQYSTNRPKYPPEELRKYASEWVAWSLDGTRILAHGKDFDAVAAEMEAAGLNPHHAVWDLRPPADVDSFL